MGMCSKFMASALTALTLKSVPTFEARAIRMIWRACNGPSGFLSELQDEIAAALSRVQREIAEKEEKATA